MVSAAVQAVRLQNRRTAELRSIRRDDADRLVGPPPRHIRHVVVGSATLRVAVQGAGRPLLLLPGLGANLDMWAPVTPGLEGFEIVAFDPPGLGESSRLHLTAGMREIARLTARLVGVLGYHQIDVLGYSWGGALAQELAYQCPDLVRRLVLCATSCGLGGVPGNPHALATLANPWRPSHSRPAHFAGYTTQLGAISRWTSLPWLHRLPQPTLVVAGDDDRVVPVPNAHLLAALIPDSRLHIVPGAGHLLLLDQAERLVPAIREFLLDEAGTPPGPAESDGQIHDPKSIRPRRRAWLRSLSRKALRRRR